MLQHELVPPLTEREGFTISDEMSEVRVRGVHRIEVVDKKGCVSQARLELRYRRIRVMPPIGKQDRNPTLLLTVLFAQERGKPTGRGPIDWRLITDLPATSREQAIEKLRWYAQRWKIETFHKILKSGCKAEELRLRSAERLVNAISVFCILAWRIFWMTIIRRTAPRAPSILAFTEVETHLLDGLNPSKDHSSQERSVVHYITRLAMLGGYPGRRQDSPPGSAVVWRGLCRLTDIALGYEVRGRDVGN